MDVDWSNGAEHMWNRHGVSVEEANEALADPDVLLYWPDPRSKSGRSVRVIGHSPTRQRLLTVILVEDPAVPWLWGANAWPSNSTDQREYRERNRKR